MTERRRALLEVSGEAFLDVIREQSSHDGRVYRCCRYGIPLDAQVVGIRQDPLRDVWIVVLEGPSFPICNEYDVPIVLPSPIIDMIDLSPLKEAVEQEQTGIWTPIMESAKKVVSWMR